jgi:hypothetical protein
MTGSGKTALCIALIEEAALQGIPALVIDPKGDLTNLLLHFPDMAPADFQPWLDAELARREGKSIEQLSAETAALWTRGLAEWAIPAERLRELAETVEIAVYTPGSDAGLKLSVVSSLEAPSMPWEGNREVLREKISSAVTALLGLVGFQDIDPVRSREHILVANIFESAWSQGHSLDMTELILQIQTPPFEKLGAFQVDTFFPAKERLELAMRLNNILASPGFEAWREGEPMDIGALLYTREGKPRHSIFYIAHLSDAERMFFVTLLLSAVETWMRSQPGSGALRTVLYFDEIFGYLPPQSNPPSKLPLLRMLKQARAFGVGLLLATQNPVDLDYKGLSNAGTWFIGKLQTERDKARLLDGLESIAAGLDREAYARMISSLGKRVFLLHNVHAPSPVVFESRWAMNYLAGPLTRAQIPALNELARAQPLVLAQDAGTLEAESAGDKASGLAINEVSPHVRPPAQATLRVMEGRTGDAGLPGTRTRPIVPRSVDELFLPMSFSLPEAYTAAAESPASDAELAGILYRPNLLASARVRLRSQTYELDVEQELAALVDSFQARGVEDWDEATYRGPSLEAIANAPVPQARFDALGAAMGDEKLLRAIRKDFEDWVYRRAKSVVRVNRKLKLVGRPGISHAGFLGQCSEAARAGRDQELDKLDAKFERRRESLEHRLDRESRELEADRDELDSRKSEVQHTQLEAVMGVFQRGRIRRFSRMTAKNRLKDQAKADVEESEAEIAHLREQMEALEAEYAQAVEEVQQRWSSLASEVEEVTITPGRDGVFVEHFGVAWMPFYLVKAGDALIELPAFGGA